MGEHLKRILCIIGTMNAGGAETFLMKIYRGLDKTRYQMDFCIQAEDECFYEDEINALGGRVYRIPPKSKSIKAFKKGLFDIIKDHQYRYVLRITSNAMGFLDLAIAKKAGAEVRAVRSSNSSDGEGMKKKLAHCVGKLLYTKYVNVKIAPSDLAAKYTFGEKAYHDGEVSLLHNAVDINTYAFSEQARKEIRDELGLDQETILVGHVGRFMKQKNHAFLLDVFKQIKEQNQKAVLLLVGAGGLEQEIRLKAQTLGIADSVLFAGIRKDIPRVLSAMDVFVFPSFYEGMPNTVIEAQATGLPCVIADTITKEADITGLVEYLPLSLSPEEWAKEALSRVNKQRVNTKAMFIQQGYDIESVVNQFISLVFR